MWLQYWWFQSDRSLKYLALKNDCSIFLKNIKQDLNLIWAMYWEFDFLNVSKHDADSWKIKNFSWNVNFGYWPLTSAIPNLIYDEKVSKNFGQNEYLDYQSCICGRYAPTNATLTFQIFSLTKFLDTFSSFIKFGITDVRGSVPKVYIPRKVFNFSAISIVFWDIQKVKLSIHGSN